MLPTAIWGEGEARQVGAQKACLNGGGNRRQQVGRALLAPSPCTICLLDGAKRHSPSVSPCASAIEASLNWQVQLFGLTVQATTTNKTLRHPACAQFDRPVCTWPAATAAAKLAGKMLHGWQPPAAPSCLLGWVTSTASMQRSTK